MNDCVIWSGVIDKNGYGRLGGRPAHRVVYQQARGPIPLGMQLDHLCRVRACVNPDHLEAVTKRENQRRGLKGDFTTHCPSGHAYDAENTYRDKRGHRFCRACNRAAVRAYKARKRALL